MLIGDGSCACTDAVDEGACRGSGGVLGCGDLDWFAGAAVGHLSGWVVGSAGGYALSILCRSLRNAVRFVEEGCVFECEIERAFAAVEPELVSHLCVGAHGGEEEAAGG